MLGYLAPVGGMHRSVALLEEVHVWGQALRFQKPCIISRSLSLAVSVVEGVNAWLAGPVACCLPAVP